MDLSIAKVLLDARWEAIRSQTRVHPYLAADGSVRGFSIVGLPHTPVRQNGLFAGKVR
jgi:hypothetical protein